MSDVFKEGNSDSAAMIVLEGDKPLGDEAHAFYDKMIAKLEPTTSTSSRCRTSGAIR